MSQTAFLSCETCAGRGFLRTGGDFFERKYPRCTVCQGVGQRYLETPPTPPQEGGKQGLLSGLDWEA